MNPDRLFVHTAQITRATTVGTRDEWGNPNPGVPTTTTNVKCWVHPTATAGIDEPGRGESFDHTGFFPAGTDIVAGDEVTLADGRSWHVDGPPMVHHNPRTDTVEYLEVRLTGYTYEQ